MDRINEFESDQKKATQLEKYWNTILLWSGYDCYLELELIARIQKTTLKTVKRRLQWFKKNYPEQYEKIKIDRAAIRSASCKLDQQLKQMKEGQYLSYDSLDADIRDNLIKEKF